MRVTKMWTAVLLMLSLASAASAQQLNLQMTGEWFSNRGPLIDIPQNGGPQPQFPCEVTTGCLTNFKPAAGGIPVIGGTANVSVGFNLGGPASIMLAPGVFGQNKLNTPSTNLLPIVPTVVQLQTFFEVFAPATEEGPGTPGDSPDRILRADAWTNQTGRLGPAFAFCPGPVTGAGATLTKIGFVTNCTNSNASTGPGAYNGIVQYSGNGANNFGGTMAILLNGSGFVSVIIATTGGTQMVPIVAHQPIGTAGVTSLRSQITGAGYALLSSAYLQSGPANIGFMTNATAGKITSIGPSTPNIFIPQDRNLNWGFPHTTGQISIMNVETNQGQPGNTTLVATGTDSRDAFGRGNITLVSGATSHRVFANQNSSALNILNMTFTPEPGPSLMLGASLLAIGGLYAALRRRHGRSAS
ncbi:MAG: hypothetical protein ACX98W_16330 [bacterium]